VYRHMQYRTQAQNMTIIIKSQITIFTYHKSQLPKVRRYVFVKI